METCRARQLSFSGNDVSRRVGDPARMAGSLAQGKYVTCSGLASTAEDARSTLVAKRSLE